MNKAFRATLDQLPTMLDFVQSHAATIGFTELQVSKIVLAAEEVIVNAISYGYPMRSVGTIEIECKPDSSGGIDITIRDDGIPFNPLANPVNLTFTPSSLEYRKIGGFGILVVLRMMDKVTYRHERGQNVLTLEKYLRVEKT